MKIRLVIYLLAILLLVLTVVCKGTTKGGFASGPGYKYTHSGFIEADVSTNEHLGKYVIVPFFSTYCPPCMKNLPKIAKKYEQYAHEDVVIVAIALEPKGGEARLLRVLNKHKIKGSVICEFTGWSSKLARQHNVTGIPYYFALNKSGGVIARSTSFREIFKAIKLEMKK